MLRRWLRALKSHREKWKNKVKKGSATYSKLLLSIIVSLASVWITWSYVLATHAQIIYENSDPLISLSEEVCRTILGAVVAYCIKSGVENISKGITGDFSSDSLDDDVVG